MPLNPTDISNIEKMKESFNFIFDLMEKLNPLTINDKNTDGERRPPCIAVCPNGQIKQYPDFVWS